MALDRRALLRLAAGLLSGAALGEGAGRDEVETLSRVLGLGPRRQSWLADLSLDEQGELLDALRNAGRGPVAPRTVQLLARVLGARSRLYDFLDYPDVADIRSLCDGLIRE